MVRILLLCSIKIDSFDDLLKCYHGPINHDKRLLNYIDLLKY